jgi:hypothetical protein
VETVSIIPEGQVVYGIQLPVQSQSTMYREDWEPSSGPAELARIARQADESDFFYIAVCDHTFIPARLAPAMSTTWYDTIATLGWLAGFTSRVRLLSHVYIATLRHPLRAAKEFATLDLLSNGRLIVGVGAGHVTEEFEVLGPEFLDRGKALDESIDAIAAALVDEFPVLPGPRWPASDLGIGPRPVQRPRPPIWVGGSSPPALRRAAARGDGWLQSGRAKWRNSSSFGKSSERVLPSPLAPWPEFSMSVNRPGSSPGGRSPDHRRRSPRTWLSSPLSAAPTSSSASPPGRRRSSATRWPPSASSSVLFSVPED